MTWKPPIIESDNLNILGVGILSIHNMKIPSPSCKVGGPQIERATAFCILIEFLLDHVHLGGGCEVAVADQVVRRQDENSSGKLG